MSLFNSNGRTDAQLLCLEYGRHRDCSKIRVCNNSIKNMCSAGMLRDRVYRLQLLRVPLMDLWHLPNICRNGGVNIDEVHLTDSMHKDPLEKLHLRCRHKSKFKLLEGRK